MSNIYFPDQEITFNDLYFVCYMIERTARAIKQRNNYVVGKMGKDGLARPWKDEYGLEQGNVDVTKVDARFTDKVPSETQMGKVYARLISSVTQDDELVESIQKVYASPICDAIDNYNSSAYYEPSYVQTRAFLNNQF